MGRCSVCGTEVNGKALICPNIACMTNQKPDFNGGMKMQVKYRDEFCEKYAPLKHAKPGDCGYDLAYAPVERICKQSDSGPVFDSIVIFPNTFVLVPSGVSVKIPDGFFGLICGRSSTFGKRGLFVVEARIDSGFTGELFVKVWHPAVFGDAFVKSPAPSTVHPWERLAQIVILPYASPLLEIVDELPDTERGKTGFGSSGK